MPKREKQSGSERLTAIYLDGNSLMAAVVSLTPSGVPHIHALRHVETEDLVERIDRVPHPIFMNTEHLTFPNQQILSQALDVLLDGEKFRNPVVGILPPDLVDLWTDEAPCIPNEHLKRVRSGIKSVLDGNPYGYPKLISYDLLNGTATGDNGQKRVRLWTCRFDDVLSIADQMLRLELPFIGVVTSQRALNEITREAAAEQQGAPFVLIDLGKLRTTYTGMDNSARTFTHAIPVGLARDDNRYFSSFTPTMQRLREIAQSSNSLFIPPDYTPTSLFDAYPATPQVEVTRFASNVAEYMARVMTIMSEKKKGSNPPTATVTGLVSALPGLQEYLERRTGTIIQTPKKAINSAWTAEDPDILARTRYHLAAIGGAIAFLRQNESRFGIVMRDNRPLHFSISGATIPEMKPGTVYVMEWGSRG